MPASPRPFFRSSNTSMIRTFEFRIPGRTRRWRPGSGGVVRRWGDRRTVPAEHPTDRCEPEPSPVVVDEPDYHSSRGSSSRTKKLDVANKISLARVSSRTSASRPLIRFVSSVVVPGHSPASITACFTQPRNASGLTPTRPPMRCTAALTDNVGSSLHASHTNRIPHSRNPYGYFLDAGMIPTLPRNQTHHQTQGDSLTPSSSRPSRARSVVCCQIAARLRHPANIATAANARITSSQYRSP